MLKFKTKKDAKGNMVLEVWRNETLLGEMYSHKRYPATQAKARMMREAPQYFKEVTA